MALAPRPCPLQTPVKIPALPIAFRFCSPTIQTHIYRPLLAPFSFETRARRRRWRLSITLIFLPLLPGLKNVRRNVTRVVRIQMDSDTRFVRRKSWNAFGTRRPS